MLNQDKRRLRDEFEAVFASFLGGMMNIEIALALTQGIVANSQPILSDVEWEKVDQFLRSKKTPVLPEDEADELPDPLDPAPAPDDLPPAPDTPNPDSPSGTKVLIRVSHHGTIPLVRDGSNFKDIPVTRAAGASIIEGGTLSGTFSVDPAQKIGLLDFGNRLRFVLSDDLLTFLTP